MADISLEWGGDLSVSDTGDLVIVDQADELRQRVIRRFLTNAQLLDTARGVLSIMPDNLFEVQYGGNARAYVDSVVDSEVVARIQHLLLHQLAQEPTCDALNSKVSVVFDKSSGSIIVSAHVLLNTGSVVTIPAFEVSP